MRYHETDKETIVEITTLRVIMLTLWVGRVLDVKKVAYELSGPCAKVGAPQGDSDSSNPENLHKNVFLTKNFVLNIL